MLPCHAESEQFFHIEWRMESISLSPSHQDLSLLLKGGTLRQRFSYNCIWSQTYHQYSFGRYFTILSDHKPLQHHFKETSAIHTLASACIQRWERWALIPGAYDYHIEYKPGLAYGNADMLS